MDTHCQNGYKVITKAEETSVVCFADVLVTDVLVPIVKVW